MKKIAVIGTGTAGIQSLCHFLGFSDFEVTSIYNPAIPILGIGESTNPSFLEVLGIGMDFDYSRDLEELDATVKTGTKFIKWRDHDFLNPLIYNLSMSINVPTPWGFGLTRHVAIHFNNFKLKELAFKRLGPKWGNRFKRVEGNITGVYDNEDNVVIVVDGVEHEFDYAIDCRGFPTDFTDYHVIDQAPVNHAFCHSVKEYERFDYTGHRATQDGWMFEIPLSSRLTYGYLFNDKITDPKTAKENFSKEIGVPLDQMDNTEYSFKSYYSKKVIGNRVAKNGNRAVFFEPMSANSIWSYDFVNRIFFDYAVRGNISKEVANEAFVNNSKAIEEIIYFYYHGGSTYDTAFWRNAVAYTKPYVLSCDNFTRTLAEFQKLKPELEANPQLLQELNKPNWIFGPQNLRLIDQNFRYNYFQ